MISILCVKVKDFEYFMQKTFFFSFFTFFFFFFFTFFFLPCGL